MHLCAPRPVSGSQTTPGILSHAYLPTPTGARGPCPPHRAPPAHCTEHPCPPHRADLFTPKGARGPCLSHPCPSHKHPLPTSTGAQGQAAHPPTPGPPGACCVRGRHHSPVSKAKVGRAPGAGRSACGTQAWALQKALCSVSQPQRRKKNEPCICCLLRGPESGGQQR